MKNSKTAKPVVVETVVNAVSTSKEDVTMKNSTAKPARRTNTATIMTRDIDTLKKIKCPECDSAGTLAFEEGCLKCHACGYSMC